MRAAAMHVWGEATLGGKTVGVAGVGKVGKHLVGHLIEAGSNVVVPDVDAKAGAALPRSHPAINDVPHPAAAVPTTRYH